MEELPAWLELLEFFRKQEVSTSVLLFLFLTLSLFFQQLAGPLHEGVLHFLKTSDFKVVMLFVFRSESRKMDRMELLGMDG